MRAERKSNTAMLEGVSEEPAPPTDATKEGKRQVC